MYPNIKKTFSVVINTDYGGFRLSDEAQLRIAARKGLELEYSDNGRFLKLKGEKYKGIDDICQRDDPDLVAVVREMGKAASTVYSDLEVVDVTVEVNIDEYDGKERVTGAGAWVTRYDDDD